MSIVIPECQPICLFWLVTFQKKKPHSFQTRLFSVFCWLLEKYEGESEVTVILDSRMSCIVGISLRLLYVTHHHLTGNAPINTHAVSLLLALGFLVCSSPRWTIAWMSSRLETEFFHNGMGNACKVASLRLSRQQVARDDYIWLSIGNYIDTTFKSFKERDVDRKKS